jgi:hypothetical protein
MTVRHSPNLLLIEEDFAEPRRVEHLAITRKLEARDGLHLTLQGKMTANGIGELRREVEEARRRRKPVFLDMTEVTLLDRFSAEYLNSIVSHHVHFENCPMYIRPWLNVVNGQTR